MPTDAGMISCIVHHLHQVALGARVDKIHQPDRDSITLQLYTSTGTQRLELCASSERPFIGFTTSDKTAPQHPTQFCLLLRKHLASGGRVTGVEQIGFDRALRISFDAKDDMGFVQQRVLVYETMGKFSNVVLCDPTKILGVLRPVDFATSSLRQLLVGMTYQPPPPQDKGNPLEETEAGFANRASATSTEQRAERFIMNNYAGFSPLIAREIAYRATGQTDAPIGGNEGAIWQAFSSVATAIREGSFAPTLLSGEGLSDYSFCDIAQYGESAERRIFDTPSQLLQTYLGTRVTKGGGFAHDISVLVRRALAKAERKIETITADLAGTAEREKYRIWGELITANIHAIKPRMDKVEVQDYYSENLDTVEIPLDPRLSPAANAQRYYRLYSKQKKGQILGTQQLEAAEGELKYLQSVQDSLSRVTSHAEAAEIRRELAASGYASRARAAREEKRGKKQEAAPPLEYRTSGGYTVYCGKNNLHNDHITHRLATGGDYWFHVQDAPGSHVVMICDGMDEPPAEDFTQAAMIAAVNSSLSEGVNVPVDYTLVKNIKKPQGGAPGFVTYSTHHTAFVTPNRDKVEGLRARE